MSIYRTILSLSRQLIANEWVIIVAHRRRIPRLFQLETQHVSRRFNLKQPLVHEA